MNPFKVLFTHPSAKYLKDAQFSLNFGTCQDHSILEQSMSAIFKKVWF